LDGRKHYSASGCNSVKEVAVSIRNTLGGGKNNYTCGGHPQEENGESSSSRMTFISGNIWDFITLPRRHLLLN